VSIHRVRCSFSLLVVLVFGLENGFPPSVVELGHEWVPGDKDCRNAVEDSEALRRVSPGLSWHNRNGEGGNLTRLVVGAGGWSSSSRLE